MPVAKRIGGPFAHVVFVTSLGNVKLHVFLAVMMMLAVPSSLHKRPKAFDSVGVNKAVGIFTAVIDAVACCIISPKRDCIRRTDQ